MACRKISSSHEVRNKDAQKKTPKECSGVHMLLWKVYVRLIVVVGQSPRSITRLLHVITELVLIAEW